MGKFLECKIEYKVYIFNSEGKYPGYVFVPRNAKNIARIIARATSRNNIKITDIFDLVVLDTFGNIINYCGDKELLMEVQEYLIPMQMGEVDPFEEEIIFDIPDIEMTKEKFKELTLKHCQYQL